MTTYSITVPPTWHMGSRRGICRSRADALQEYNQSRARDGLPPLKRMPNGTRYTRIEGTKP